MVSCYVCELRGSHLLLFTCCLILFTRCYLKLLKMFAQMPFQSITCTSNEILLCAENEPYSLPLCFSLHVAMYRLVTRQSCEYQDNLRYSDAMLNCFVAEEEG